MTKLFKPNVFDGLFLDASVIHNMLPSKSSFNKNRKTVRDYLIDYFGTTNPENLTIKDLQVIFDILDDVYFNSLMRFNLDKEGYQLVFECSKRMTKTAGSCGMKNKLVTITISLPVFLVDFEKIKNNAGVTCSNRLEALIETFEHELAHLVMNLFKAGKGHDAHFKTFVKHNFGHTKCTHDLIERKPVKDDNGQVINVKEELKVGSRVTFNKGKMQGYVTKINTKSVKVTEETCQLKYNVPFGCITSIVNEDLTVSTKKLKELEKKIELKKESEKVVNKTTFEIGDFKVGSRVVFAKGQLEGRVIKVNRKTVQVEIPSGVKYVVQIGGIESVK